MNFAKHAFGDVFCPMVAKLFSKRAVKLTDVTPLVLGLPGMGIV